MPEPIKSTKGGTDIGPRDPTRDAENPDILVPPSTDKGLVPNLRFSFADAHMNLQDGGWSREVTQRELPVATEMAGVNMRLKTGGVRELHWHKQAEWSIMLTGNARITAVDSDGKNFIADVSAGDLWYFPAGTPHSIQGLGPDGCEFLLAFPTVHSPKAAPSF
jgi:oxalate decarboxylase